jgi:hypothetical protein
MDIQAGAAPAGQGAQGPNADKGTGPGKSSSRTITDTIVGKYRSPERPLQPPLSLLKSNSIEGQNLKGPRPVQPPSL